MKNLESKKISNSGIIKVSVLNECQTHLDYSLLEILNAFIDFMLISKHDLEQEN